MRRTRRASRTPGPGQRALWAALRRWRPRAAQRPAQDAGKPHARHTMTANPRARQATTGDSHTRQVAPRDHEPGPPPSPSPAPAADPRRWWPRLSPPQVQALLGAALTLALLLWDQVRQRLQQP